MKKLILALAVHLMLAVNAFCQADWPQPVSFMATARNGDFFEVVMQPDDMRPGYVNGINSYSLPSIYRDQVEEVWDDGLGYWDGTQGYWTESTWVPVFKYRSPVDGRDWDSLEAYFQAYADFVDADGEQIEIPDPLVVDALKYCPGTWVAVPVWVPQPGYRQVVVQREFKRFEIVYAEMGFQPGNQSVSFYSLSQLYEVNEPNTAVLVDQTEDTSVVVLDWYTGFFADSRFMFIAAATPAPPTPLSNGELERHTFTLDVVIDTPKSGDPSPAYVVGNKAHQEFTFTYNTLQGEVWDTSYRESIGATKVPVFNPIAAASLSVGSSSPLFGGATRTLLFDLPDALPKYTVWETVQGSGTMQHSFDPIESKLSFNGHVYSYMNALNWFSDSAIDWDYNVDFQFSPHHIEGTLEYNHDKYPTFTFMFDQDVIENTPQGVLWQLNGFLFGQHHQVVPFSFSW